MKGFTIVEVVIAITGITFLVGAVAGICVLVHFIAKFW